MSTIPQEIQSAIRLLRKEAKQKNDAADALEQLYGTVESHVTYAQPTLVINTARGSSPFTPSLDDLIRYLDAGNGGRVNHIAQHFGCEESHIRHLILISGGKITIIERGWVKLTSALEASGL